MRTLIPCVAFAAYALVPPTFHWEMTLALALACVAWRLRRLMPAPTWAAFFIYQGLVVAVCHADWMNELACAVLSAAIWGLGVPLWAWAERRAERQCREAKQQGEEAYLGAIERHAVRRLSMLRYHGD